MDGTSGKLEAKNGDTAVSTGADRVSAPMAEFRSHDPRSIDCNRWAGLISTASVGAAFSGASLIVVLATGGLWWIATIVMGAGIVITVALGAYSLYHPKWEYDRASWRLDEIGLHIRQGIFWRRQISVPVARVQHTDVSQGPLERRFGLGTLTVHTAGTENALVLLEGLALETANEIRDKLVAQRRSGHVL